MVYLFPRLNNWYFKIGSWQGNVSDPLQEWPVFFWGRKIKLRPDYRLSLAFRSGFKQILAVNKINLDQLAYTQTEDENIGDYEALAKRLHEYYQTEVHYQQKIHDQLSYLLLNSPVEFGYDELTLMSNVPAKLSFYIQKNEIAQEEMAFTDNLLENFRQIEISNKNLTAVRPLLDYQTQSPVLGIYLDSLARSSLFREMQANRDKLLMVMIDDQVVLLSPIGEPVTNGRLTIAGGRSLNQAKQLAVMLMHPFEKCVFAVENNYEVINQMDNVDNSKDEYCPSLILLMGYVLIVLLLCIIGVIVGGKIFSKVGVFVGFSHLGFVALHLLVIRLMERIVSPALLTAMILVVGWWVVLGWVALKQLSCLENNEQRATLNNFTKVFTFKNRWLKNSVGLLFVSSWLVMAFAQSKLLPATWSSDEFAKELMIFSVSSYLYYFSLIIHWKKRIS